MKKIIDLKIKSKNFKHNNVTSLQNFSLAVNQGETIAITGDSGVGKSTLLNILGLLDSKYEGYYNLFGHDMKKMSEKEKASMRNNQIGFVLQESSLINNLTIKENILLPRLYNTDIPRSELGKRMMDLARSLDIINVLDKKPLECSGGQKSRAAFARAVIMHPKLILADEPTASLDESNKENMISVLKNFNQNNDVTILIVTHDLDVANRFLHQLILKS
ncbi:ABC transporter ATP-binding protein [Aerococcus urinaeequi]|uniref:ABC transporter ATP-binding protein n=1 Tax=Aerococcus urinaeequi TaxID=51665 RepID=UPI003AB0A4A2